MLAVPAHAAGDTQARTVRLDGTAVTFDLVPIPSGDVRMGEGDIPVGPFEVSRTEVTWDLYDIYLYALDVPEGGDEAVDGITRPTKPYVPPDRGYGHAGFPAMGMTRHAAMEFCRWLSDKTGDTYRLPTKAEWIYLAEAGGGETGGAWHEDNADYTTRPVGKKAPNAFGLVDMLGNVAEWVAPAPGERPQDHATAMGGSFLDIPASCSPRSEAVQQAGWNASDPQIPKSLWWLADCDFVGFRIIREPASETGERVHNDPFRYAPQKESD